MFDELMEIINKPLGVGYRKMTEAEFQCSYIDDVIEWAEKLAGEWNGDNAGRLEERANRAQEIIDKCAELKNLIMETEEI